MKTREGYDLIGDIHGRFDKLGRLMERLGYHADREGSFIPPPGRRAIFLGDLIDPKRGHRVPGGVRKTLQAVKVMIGRGDALCVMGNHEFNALCFHATGSGGEPLRAHDAKNQAMHRGTLEDFPDWQEAAGEWRTLWLPWLETLPFYLDLGGLRAVHASWDPRHLELLRDRSLTDKSFLEACADEHSREGAAIEASLKGIRVGLPAGHEFADSAGVARDKIRVRWWLRPDPHARCSDLVFPENPQIPDLPPVGGVTEQFAPYPEQAVPVFFGHYAKAADAEVRPEAPNVACLDYSGGSRGPLLAYRWAGEDQVRTAGYVAAG